MYTKPSPDKAAYRAVLFYNSRNKYSFKDGKCRMPMCMEGKCICLDTLQAKLLCSFTGENADPHDEHIVFEAKNGATQYFSYSESKKTAQGVCRKQPDLPFDLYDFGQFDKANYKRELNVIAEGNIVPERMFTIFQGLSVFFLVNSTAELQERDSELYLAAYGYGAEVLLKMLFIGIMETVIARTLRDESLDGVDNAIEHVCDRMCCLAEQKNENLNKVVDILEKFDNCIRSVDLTIESYVGDDLIDYREKIGLMCEVQQGKELGDAERSTVEEWLENERKNLREALPIYALTKEVCSSVGLEVNWPEKLRMEQLLRDEGGIRDYDVKDLIDKLKSVSGESHKESRNVVLGKLGEMLRSYNPMNGSFLSEDIESLK